MQNNKPIKSFSTGLLIALGLIVSGFYTNTQAVETVVKAKIQHHSDMHKSMKGMSNMRMDISGLVMNENKDKLPKDCTEISEDVTIEVKAGVKYSRPYPGTVFGYSEHQWHAKPCSRITVKYTNEDEIRHQWMIHGLPKYLYPTGMFQIEINGKGTKTGSFIVPSSNFTYLVHCDIAQHTEKGMKAELIVGNGRGDLPSIPGISAPKYADSFN
ncbi:MAG: copper oxidase [Methylococcales bacterium]